MACPLGGRQCNGPCGGMINGPIHCSLVFPPATKYAPTNKLNYLCAACAAKPECLSLAPFMEIAGPFDPPAPKMAALLRGVSSAPDRKQDRAAAALSVVVAWLNQTGYKLGSSKYLSGDFLAQLQDFCKAFTELLDSPHCSTPVAQGYALTACGLLVRNVEDPQLSDALIKAALKLATKALPARGAFASGDLCNGALDALGQGGVMMRPTDEKTKAVAAAGGVAWARRALAMGGSGYTYINGFNLLETLLPLSPPPADEVPELIEAMLAAVGKTDQDEARKSGFWMVLKLVRAAPQTRLQALIGTAPPLLIVFPSPFSFSRPLLPGACFQIPPVCAVLAHAPRRSGTTRSGPGRRGSAAPSTPSRRWPRRRRTSTRTTATTRTPPASPAGSTRSPRGTRRRPRPSWPRARSGGCASSSPRRTLGRGARCCGFRLAPDTTQ